MEPLTEKATKQSKQIYDNLIYYKNVELGCTLYCSNWIVKKCEGKSRQLKLAFAIGNLDTILFWLFYKLMIDTIAVG